MDDMDGKDSRIGQTSRTGLTDMENDRWRRGRGRHIGYMREEGFICM